MNQAIDPTVAVPPASSALRSNSLYVFWLMWGMNFLNYLDRFAFAGASPLIQKEFQLNDAQVGLLGSAFLLTYTIGILPLGLLADRIKRKFVIAGGVSFWSIATFLTGLVPNFGLLFTTRAALGLGEGSYFPAGTALLSSYYPSKVRATVMSRWNTGLLAGSAVGFALGGLLADAIGWRFAFFIFGIPGLILALLAVRLHEPPRAAVDDVDVPELALARAGIGGIVRDLVELSGIRTLRITFVVQALGFFVIGASTTFLNILLVNQFGIRAGTAGLISGGVLVVGGISGLLVGSWLANRLQVRFEGARVLVSGLGFLLAAPFFAAAILAVIATQGLATNVRLYALFVPFFFITVLLLNVYSGPLTAVVQDVTPPARRAAAIGLTLMLSHLLGDLFSPTLVGLLGDYLKTNGTSISWIQQLGVTQQNSLGVSLLVFCVPVLLISGLVGMRGSRSVKHDREAAQRVAAQSAAMQA